MLFLSMQIPTDGGILLIFFNFRDYFEISIMRQTTLLQFYNFTDQIYKLFV